MGYGQAGQEPTLAEVIVGALNSRLADVHTVKVGKIHLYDPTTGRADITPMTLRPYNIGNGVYDHEELPVIPDVPVVQPRAGGHFISLPVAVGDHVLVLFTDDSIAKWRETGALSEPGELRRHSLGSAVAIHGFGKGDDDVLSQNPLDLALRVAGMVLGKDGSPAQIAWDGHTITIGRPNPLANRVSPVALGDRTDARLAALEGQLVAVTAALTVLTATVAAGTTAAATSATAFASHTHNVPAPVGAPTGPAIGVLTPGAPPGPPPPPFVPVPLSTAADVLKATGPLP